MTPQNPAVSNSSKNSADARWIFDGGSTPHFRFSPSDACHRPSRVRQCRREVNALSTLCSEKRSPRAQF
jgi:hypothetical protein